MTTPLNNKKGTTLVELIVCLVLLALFGTAAVTLVKPCAEAYIEVQRLTRAQNLADALTETIRGELAAADGTLAIVSAATGEADADAVLTDSGLNEGTGLRFTVENNYVEVLDAGYVPLLKTTTLTRDGTSVEKTLYDPNDDTFAELNRYLHMRFYKHDEDKTELHEKYPTYAYTTAYPNGDYMGLVLSDLKFSARGWARRTVTTETGDTEEKIYLTSLTMELTVARPTTSADGTTSYTPVYTQKVVIPLPGSPEFQ